mmetsp:Transcript_29413/g.66433  ORF Transcript_29413/g.66433 Transcript_29413/m.66433 type:complete len:80 (-) Transcript_29413:21-260(-)
MSSSLITMLALKPNRSQCVQDNFLRFCQGHRQNFDNRMVLFFIATLDKTCHIPSPECGKINCTPLFEYAFTHSFPSPSE